MTTYEYKVVPAPTKGLKAKGVKTPEGRFANSVQSVLNAEGGDGWEYLRSELLPSDERTGLTGSTTHWRNVLVFRRALPDVQVPADVEVPGAEAPAVEVPVEVPAEVPTEVPIVKVSDADESAARVPEMASGAERMLRDDGVEELSPVSGITTALKARAEQQAGEQASEQASGQAGKQGDDSHKA